MGTPDIPSWEWTDLEQLSSEGDLFGLSPVVVGSIAQAEEPPDGDEGINSSGYGGYFGLGTSPYAGGLSVSAATLESSGSAAFEQEAPVAADAFNQYLSEAGGNAVTAEEIYQSGSASGPTEGSEIMAANLGSASPGGGGSAPSGSSTSGASATTTGLDLNPLNLFGIPSTLGDSTASAFEQAADAFFSGGGNWLAEAGFAAAGITIMLLGVWAITKNSGIADDVAKGAPLAAAAA